MSKKDVVVIVGSEGKTHEAVSADLRDANFATRYFIRTPEDAGPIFSTILQNGQHIGAVIMLNLDIMPAGKRSPAKRLKASKRVIETLRLYPGLRPAPEEDDILAAIALLINTSDPIQPEDLDITPTDTLLLAVAIAPERAADGRIAERVDALYGHTGSTKS